MEQLELVDSVSNLETMPRADLPAIWEDFRAQAIKLKATAETLTITDVSQVAEMKIARATRLTLRQLRLAVENKRKELGEEALRRKQGIDTSAKALKDLIEPLETRLLEQEQFAERKEQERIANLVQERSAALAEYHGNTSMIDLGALTVEQFDAMLADAKLLHDTKMEAARKEEEARIAKEQADAEERARVRSENERLRKEAAQREAALQAERDKAAADRAEAEAAARKAREAADAQLLAEREKATRERKAAEAAAQKEREDVERKREAAEAIAAQERASKEKLEREARERQQREEAERKAQLAAEKKAAAAPDKAKLISYSSKVASIERPGMATLEGMAIMAEIEKNIAKFTAWVEGKASGL